MGYFSGCMNTNSSLLQVVGGVKPEGREAGVEILAVVVEAEEDRKYGSLLCVYLFFFNSRIQTLNREDSGGRA